MSANIVMNAGGGPITGSLETALSTAVALVNFDDTGVGGHRWTLRDRPIGSAASLTATGAPASSLIPDIPGTYLIQLETFTDPTLQVFDDADVQGIGVRFTGPFPWRIPAAGETVQFNPDRGWADVREEMIRDVHANLGISGVGGQTIASVPGQYAVAIGVTVGQLVRLIGSDQAGVASNASLATAPAFGIVIDKPTTTSATVAYAGEVPFPNALAASDLLYLGPAGTIVTGVTAPAVVQVIGSVKSTSELVLAPNLDVYSI